MQEIDYLTASKNSLDLIYSLEQECFPECFFTKKEILQLLNNKFADCELIYHANKIIGWACWIKRKSHKEIRLYSFCITPRQSGRGYGYKYMFKKLTKYDMEYNRCVLEVCVTNIKAINLYSKLGFYIKETLKNYYGENDGYRMLKNL